MNSRLKSAKSHMPQWLVALVLTLCTSVVVGADLQQASKAHHTETGFRNPQVTDQTGFADFIKWRWQRIKNDIPEPKTYHFERAQPDLEFLQQNERSTTATWIGHATLFMQIGGHNILTDPQFSERASPVQWFGPKRVVEPGIALVDLPEIHYVVISHDHYDSLDKDSIIALHQRPGGENTVFVVPLQLKTWFNELGISKVIELDWWESHKEKGINFTAVPTQHWSKRSLFWRNTTLWAGWVIEAAGFNFYFCGDSGYYAPMFQEVGKKLGPFDLAAIPIGAYEPRWFMKRKHINPDEAVQVHKDLKARISIGIHWGTFPLTDEPLDEPPKMLKEAIKQHKLPRGVFMVLKHGETIQF